MKRLLSIAMAVMMVLAMTVSVCAAFNGSVFQGEVPEVIEATLTKPDGTTAPAYSWELIVTPTNPSNIMYPEFHDAYNEIKNCKDITALVPGLKELLPAGVGPEDLVVRDMFDVRYLGHEDWITIDVTLKPEGITGNDTVFVVHKGVNGWEVVPSQVAWNGEVTATFTDLSPVAIVTLRTVTVDPNGPKSPATGEINVLAAGVVAAAILLA